MNERPKSREETPKEGSGMAWRAMPRCNNMSLRRTKSKVPMTPERHFRNTDAYLSRGFLPALTRAWPPALEALTLKVKPPLGCFRAQSQTA